MTMGILIAFLFKYLVEKYLKDDELGFNRTQGVEFMYAFDIYCNAFVPFYFFNVVIQFFLLPLVTYNSLINTFISNGLSFIGVVYYCYVTLLGYYCKLKLILALPFVKKNKYITFGIWPLLFIYILLSFLGVNLLKLFLGLFLI